MKQFKLFFACVLMSLFSLGQLWATPTEGSVDLSSGSFDTDHITWTVASDNITIKQIKGTSGTAVNSSYVSAPRVYKGHVLSFEAAEDYKINRIEITCSGTYYGNSMTAGTVLSSNTVTDNTTDVDRTWASTSGGTHVIEAADDEGLDAIYIQNVASASNVQLRFTALTVYYTATATGDVIIKTLKSIAVAGMTTSYDQGDAFSFDGTCTATYSVTKNSVPQPDENKTVTPTSVTSPDMTTTGDKTITVSYTENEVTKTTTYDITVNAASGDKLTRATTGISGNSYGDWADVAGASGAVYAGNSAGGNDAIQLRKSSGTQAKSGIISTTSGGYIRTVKVTWNSNTAASRTINIYGKNTAFASVDELYDNATAGTLLGTIVNGTSTQLTIDDDYEYVGVVSNSNALYLDKIVFEWEEKITPSVEKPVITGSTSFLTNTDVTLTCATAGATIYYTTDGTDPKTSATKQSGTSFSLTNTATVRAIANLGSDWSAEATSKTFTKITPITVAAAIAAIPNVDDVVDDQYVSGIVCTAGTSVSSGKMTYYISDDGSETSRLQIYKGKNLNNTNFTNVSDLALGDRVVVFGQLKNYSGTPEMNDGNYLVVKESAAVAAPVFDPNGGGFMGETDVTITCATGSSTIYYTTDGTTPSKSSNVYSAPIHINATTTITAIAYVGEEHSIVVAKTFTLTAPMTVAEALAALDSQDPINNAAVTGIISTAPTSNPSSGRLTYYISDDGTDTDELEVYLGFGLNGASFSAKTDLQVGDEVTVFGNLTIYNTTTKEFSAGNRLLAFNRPVVPVTSIDLTESTAEVEEGKTVTLHASVVPANATNKTIVWSVTSGSDKASVADGVVTGIAEGTAVIRAASDEDANIYAECTVTVTEPAPLSPWASVYTSNVAIASDVAVHVTINESSYDAAKANKASTATITLPEGVTTIHLHLVAWNGEAQTVTVSGACFDDDKNLTIEANAGVSGGGSTYDLGVSGTDYYFSLIPDKAVAADEVITITAASGKRFVLFGVNQEGGVVPASISANPASINFGSVEQNALVAAKTTDITLTSVAAATITLAGDDVFSIDKTALTENGTITVTPNTATIGTYAATITISDDATAAADVVVNVSMTVTEPIIPDDVSGIWTLVSDASTLAAGKKIIIAQYVDADGEILTMGKQNTNNRAQVTSAVAGTQLTPAIGTNVFTLVDAGDGKFAIQASNGKYLSAAGTGTNNHLKEAANYENDNEKWAISITSGDAKIQALSDNRNTIRYNSNNEIFSCYAEDGQNAVAIYVWTKTAATVTAADMEVVAGESKATAYTTNNTDNPGVTYEILSGSENIVAYNGLITGVKAGNATIRMTLAETENYTSASDEFTVTISAPAVPAKTIEAVGGKFIINAHGDTAVFSRGNLKYNVATTKWYCADHQYDFVGENGNLHFGDANYKGEFDLFGWSCGSSNYGLLASNHDEAFTGDFIDWGGLFTSGEDEWSSLSKDEMNYIIAHHKWTTLVLDPTPADADNEDEIYGLALFPYDWVMPAGFEGLHYSLCDWNEETKFADNTIDLAAWPTLEDAGAVFLPMAGARAGHWGNNWNGSAVDSRKNPNPNGGSSYCWVDNIGWYGYYWLSTPHATNNKLADYLIFPGWSEGPTTADDDDLYLPPVVWSREKRRGNSVRLVTRKPRVPDYVRTDMIGNGVLGTLCVDHNVAINDAFGATFYELVGKNAEGKMAFEQITSGELEAGVPYLFQSNGEDLVLYYGNTKVDSPVDAGNGMHGTFSQVVLSGSDLNDVYYFANHALWSCADLIANSQPLTIPANRAYLVMSEVGDASPSPAPGRIRMTLNVNGAPQVTTGMEEITNDQSQMTNKVIIDGRLYILRGEKTYDVTGRLVK